MFLSDSAGVELLLAFLREGTGRTSSVARQWTTRKDLSEGFSGAHR